MVERTGKALDRLGLSDASLVKDVANGIGNPKDPMCTIDMQKYGEFWDAVEGYPTAFAIELIQKVTRLTVSRNRITGTSNAVRARAPAATLIIAMTCR